MRSRYIPQSYVYLYMHIVAQNETMIYVSCVREARERTRIGNPWTMRLQGCEICSRIRISVRVCVCLRYRAGVKARKKISRCSCNGTIFIVVIISLGLVCDVSENVATGFVSAIIIIDVAIFQNVESD